MLYSEFVEGTGCRETDHNYQVYKELEIIYMNTDCSKEHIYEMGRKLVDNSKTEEELRLIAEVKAEIEDLKRQLKVFQEDAKRYMEFHKEEVREFGVKETYWKVQAEWQKELARTTRNRIAALKWVLSE